MISEFEASLLYRLGSRTANGYAEKPCLGRGGGFVLYFMYLGALSAFVSTHQRKALGPVIDGCKLP